MSLYDLIFIAVVLSTLGSLGSSAALAVRGQREGARRRVRRLTLALVAYMALVTIVSLVVPRRVVALGDDECSDDWCIAVVSAELATDGADTAVEVGFRLSSRARRVSQRERFVVAYLLDAAGHRHDAEPVAGDVPFDTLLGPGEALLASRAFRVADVTDLGVVVAREGDFAFPRCCILGQGPFFRYPIVPLGRLLSP